MKYAVVKTGGKQYRVSEGDVILIDRIEGKENDALTFPEVLLYTADGAITVGTPFIPTVTVSGTILGALKGEKIRVATFKAKARSRKVRGYRHSLTQVKIDTISLGAKAEKKMTDTPEKPVVKRTRTVKKAA